jgi:hypothetical protein
VGTGLALGAGAAPELGGVTVLALGWGAGTAGKGGWLAFIEVGSA